MDNFKCIKSEENDIYIYMYVSHFKLNEEATLKGKMGLLCQLAKL